MRLGLGLLRTGRHTSGWSFNAAFPCRKQRRCGRFDPTDLASVVLHCGFPPQENQVLLQTGLPRPRKPCASPQQESTGKGDKPHIRHLLWDKPTFDIFWGGWNYWVASPNQISLHLQQQNCVRQSAKSAWVIKKKSLIPTSNEQSIGFKTPVGCWLVLRNWD